MSLSLKWKLILSNSWVNYIKRFFVANTVFLGVFISFYISLHDDYRELISKYINKMDLNKSMFCCFFVAKHDHANLTTYN